MSLSMLLNRHRNLLMYVSVAAVGGMLPCHGVMAQPQSEGSVLQFQRHEVDYNSPVGVPVGGFLMTPGLFYSALYDDNIFLRNTNLTHDFISVFKPSIALQSNWSRHEVYVGLQANKTDYRWNSQKDALDYGGILSGAYDITYGTYVDGYLRKDRQSLNRGTDEDVDGSNPIEYDSWASGIGFTRAVSYIQAKIAAFHNHTERDEDLTTAVSGDFIERDSNGLEGTLTYEYFPKNSLFVTTSHTNIDYDLVGGIGRIVNKSELKYGLNFSYWDMYNGALTFSHLRTEYSHIDNISSDPSVLFNLVWSPTQLTDVSTSIGRTYSDGNVSADEKNMTDRAKIDVSYKITEFVTGNITGSAAENTYEALSGATLRENKVYRAGVSAKYQVSDHLGFELGYDYRTKQADSAAAEYDNNRILFSLTYMH